MEETKLEAKPSEEKSKKEIETPSTVVISRKMRWILFIVLCSVSILMGVDQGTLSSTTNELSDDFDMDDVQLGGLGGMIFLGTALGCIFSFLVINKFNRKYLLLGTMTLDVLSLFFTTQTTNLFLIYLCRVIAGFTSAFVNVYLPSWTDQYGIHKYKSIMISLIHIASSLGYIFGYVSGMFIGWNNSFFLQNILLIILILIIFMVVPDKYFSMSLMPIKAKLELLKLSQSNIDKDKEKDKNIDNKDNIKDEQIIKEINEINIKINDEENKDKLIDENEKKEEDDISEFEDIQTRDEDISKESILLHLKVLIKSPIFILMNITLSSMFIIVSAIQFWINDYLEFGLLIEDKNVRLSSFSFVVATAPAAGIILGGILAGKVGGYDKENAIYIPLFTSFGVVILANICPIFTNLFIFMPLFWTLLFLGSVLLPVANGIVLVSVDQKYSGSGSAVSLLTYNILGRLPGPNFYAFLKSIVNDKNSRIPFWLLLNVSIFGFLAVLICVKFQKEKYRRLRNSNNSEEHEKILSEENETEKEEKKEKEEKEEKKENEVEKDETFQTDEKEINNSEDIDANIDDENKKEEN